MTETIIPLRPRGNNHSSLARVDLVAMELLTEGQATSLQAARMEAILMGLRIQRAHLAEVLTDLRGQERTGYAQADAANAELVTAINQGIVQLDLFIARARTLQETSA